MRIHYIMHAPFEKLGAIEEWASKEQQPLSGTHTYRGEQLPSHEQYDLLILMGGPQSPKKIDQFPYLRDEIIFTREAIGTGKGVLGICLGAQIIAESLGATTEKSPYKEIGVYPIELTDEAQQDPLFRLFPKQFNVMHWHNDMPGYANDSKLLAKSAGCPRQAFHYNDRVYGFQFHLEMNSALIEEMIDHCPGDLQPDQYVQSIRELSVQDFSKINQKMNITLDYFKSILN
jgi:GMP synthase (glutamine-hydrolysing)